MEVTGVERCEYCGSSECVCDYEVFKHAEVKLKTSDPKVMIAWIDKQLKTESRSTKIIGALSTAFIYLGAPTASLLIESILGWIFYSVSAIFGMIYTVRKRDKPIFMQFIYYMIWNVMAIYTRLI